MKIIGIFGDGSAVVQIAAETLKALKALGVLRDGSQEPEPAVPPEEDSGKGPTKQAVSATSAPVAPTLPPDVVTGSETQPPKSERPSLRASVLSVLRAAGRPMKPADVYAALVDSGVKTTMDRVGVAIASYPEQILRLGHGIYAIAEAPAKAALGHLTAEEQMVVKAAPSELTETARRKRLTMIQGIYERMLARD